VVVPTAGAVVATLPKHGAIAGGIFDGVEVKGAIASGVTRYRHIAIGVQGHRANVIAAMIRAIVAPFPEQRALWRVLRGVIIEAAVVPFGRAAHDHVAAGVHRDTLANALAAR
jgi:hypothetical protein